MLVLLLTSKVILAKTITIVEPSKLILLLSAELVCSERIISGLLVGSKPSLIEAAAISLVVACLELLAAQVLLLEVLIELLLEWVVRDSWHGRCVSHLLSGSHLLLRLHHVRPVWIRHESFLLGCLLSLRRLVWSWQHVVIVKWVLLVLVEEDICVASCVRIMV